MPHCKFCNHNYKGHSDEHEQSKIHLTNEREWYKKHYHNPILRKHLSAKDDLYIVKNYLSIEEDFQDRMTETDHFCGNYKMCGTITDNFNDCLDHEADCLNMTRPIITFDTNCIIQNSLTCEDCGHVFNKSAKGINPIHLLRRHQKGNTCAKKIMRLNREAISQCLDIKKQRQIRNILKQ